MDPVVEIAIDTTEKKKQALVFCSSKRGAEKQAEDIAKSKKYREFVVKDSSYLVKMSAIADAFEHSLPTPTQQCIRDAECIKYGVAFHHSGLTSEQRAIIEDGFRDGSIKIICATPTLAAGVDLPAFRTIIRDLKRYSGKWGMQYIPVLEFEQMAGRAGRPGKEDFGEAITIAATENEKFTIVDNYIYGEVENIQSKLAVEPVLRFHVLSLIASGICKSEKELLDFFEKTFYSFQFGDFSRISLIIDRVLDMLVSYEFIQKSATSDIINVGNAGTKTNSVDKIGGFGGFSSAKELSAGNNIYLMATPLGKLVSDLYLDPYTANYLILCLKKAESVFEKYDSELKTFVLLQAICLTLEMQPLVNVKSKEQDLYFGIMTENEKFFLSEAPDELDFDDFMGSIKTANFLNGWINELDEQTLLEQFDVRPGETRAKLNIADWMLRCAIEFSRSKKYFSLIKDLTKVKVRLEYGVKEELLALLQLKGIGRVRARKLYSAGIRDIGELKKKTSFEVGAIVGQKLAESILAQIK